jgi:glycosyltransferase involved in cell wall biosynthesis
MAEPDVTVLIATRDRADHLVASLTSVLQAASRASCEAEVLLVDNGSVDHTERVVEEFMSEWPVLRLHHDAVPGKSGAVNRSLEEVRGRVIVFTDDDVHVPETWVDEMAMPILDGGADAVCGKVRLAAHLDRPWLTPYLRSNLAELLDVSGDQPGMVGANMAASTEATRSIGFDEELGPGARGFADDVMFNLRLKAEGHRLVGCTGPPVEHHLSADRLNYESMKRLAQNNGSSHAYLWHHWLHDDLNLLHVRYLRAKARLAWMRHRHPRDEGSISEHEYGLWFNHSFCANLIKEKPRTPNYADNLSPTAHHWSAETRTVR